MTLYCVAKSHWPANGMKPGKTLSSALVQAIDQMFGVSVVVEDVVL